MLAGRRIRNPRPLYEYNYILKEYNSLHANWIQNISVNQKDLEVNGLYELFYLKHKMKPMKVIDLKKSIQLEEHTWTIFLITKYYIYEL